METIHFYVCLSHMLDINVRGANVATMVEFGDVLDIVRLALTRASSGEIQALLKDLVKEQIISEAYSKSLSLQQLNRGFAPGPIHGKAADKPAPGPMDDPGAANQGHLSQVCRECASTCHNRTELEDVQTMEEYKRLNTSPPVMHEHSLLSKSIGHEHYCSLRLGEFPTSTLESGVGDIESDYESIHEGNSEAEREWLEQVEQAARKIAVPLWQHWDRGWTMVLSLVPSLTMGCAISESTVTGSQAQCLDLNMEEETELAIACRTLDLCTDNFNCTEVKTTDLSYALDGEEVTKAPKGLELSTSDSMVDWTRLDYFSISGAAGNCSQVEGCAGGNRDLEVCSVADRTEALLLAGVPHSGGNVGYTVKERVDPHSGARMQKVDQDPYICPDFGDLAGMRTNEMDDDLSICPEFDLPDDLSEYMNEDYLSNIVDRGLFVDPFLYWNGDDTCSDISLPIELPSPGTPVQREEEKLTDKTNNRSKRPKGSHLQDSSPLTQSQLSTDENTPSMPKRQRVAGQPKIKKVQAEPTVSQGTGRESESSPAHMADVSTTSPRIFQLIPITDTPRYPVFRTNGFSPPVIRLPISNEAPTPTYIFVPVASPPCKGQVPPLSPVDGTVPPVQMSSSPPGSLSNTASKAMSPSCASSLSPSNEVIKEYIHDAKAHISRMCQDMEAGLSLTSHYVDGQVSQRETLFRCGKNKNKFLDKELIIMGDTDRKKSLLHPTQIFEGSTQEKSKRYILLLGNAGMGKTTLIKKLCLDWSREGVPQFDFVFLLDSKALTLTKPTFSLQTLLLNLSCLTPTCLDPDAVFAQIIAAPKRVLIIFDGFEELRDYETLLQTQEKDLITSLQRDSKAQAYTIKQLYSGILQRVLLPGCTLLLSARPRGTASQLLRRTDSYLEVCGFSPADIETYVSQYFADPALGASALECLKNCSYLHLLCWNPRLCRLVCFVLEGSKSLEVLPRTLTGLCQQVLHLKMREDSQNLISTPLQDEPVQAQTQISSNSQTKRCHKNVLTKCRRPRKAKWKQKEDEVNGEEGTSVNREVERTGERQLLFQLSSLAWNGVKANSSILPMDGGRTIPVKLKAIGQKTGLFLSYDLRTKHVLSGGEIGRGTREDREEVGGGEKRKRENEGSTDIPEADGLDDHILLWACPFLQSYLAAVHLALSRNVSDRTILQIFPFVSGQKGRRRPQREELELTQRFLFGLLFCNRLKLQKLHSYTETDFSETFVSKQAFVTKHLTGLSYGDLSPAQVLETCHYVHEASLTHGDGSRDRSSTKLIAHLAANLPPTLTFRGVPLKPSDVFVVRDVLEKGGSKGLSFCLDLEDSGIQISGIRTLVGLSNIHTYRACIADVVTLWEQLEQDGKGNLKQQAVSKFKIHPLKATQVCHIEHLAKLVNVHTHKRLLDSSNQSDSVLAEGVPAVRELYKLEFELGPVNGPKAFPLLCELLPGLHNLQHLDLENSKIGDQGAEKVADALVSLCYLEVLNLSQNSIGDQGISKLATTLRDLPKLHCLSLYSNVISDEGAKSLAGILPHMASLTDLDVKYNKLTDVGAQSLGVSLSNCKRMKTLRLWNQCIPYGVFERLQQQDKRILWH